MTLSDYARAVLHHWVTILVLLLIGAGAGFGVAYLTPDSYRSTGAVLITSDRGDSTSELVQGSTYIQNLVTTYVLLAKSEAVLQPVIDGLELQTTPRALASTIQASSPINSVIIEISATSTSPEEAQNVAQAVVESLSEVVTKGVAPTGSNGDPTIRLTAIENPAEPRAPFAPNTRLHIVLGALTGFALGVLYAVVRSLAWRPIRTKGDIEKIAAVPVLGEVVEARKGTSLPSAVLAEPLGHEAESLRGVAANLSFLRVDRSLRSITITSASPGEAKSSVATALATIVGESADRVLLIDADLRSPSLATLTQLDDGLGLANVLIGESSLEQAVQPWGTPGLDVLTAGSTAPNPGQLVASAAMSDLLDRARELYDFIIVDTAPLLAVTDAKWLSSMTDGAILAVRYDKTSVRSFEKVIANAGAGSMQLLGAVLTRVPRRGSRYGGGGYGVTPRADT